MISRELPYAKYDPRHCLNCGTDLAPGTAFCPACGQRNREHRKPLIQWIAEGLSTFLHLEGKTLTTLRDLPVPGRMVGNYLNGRRERYLHPLRLLLLSSLLCFAVVRLTDGGEDADIVKVDFENSMDIDRTRAEFDRAINEVAVGSERSIDFDVEDHDAKRFGS